MLTLPEPEATSIDDERLDLVDGVTEQLSRLRALLQRVTYLVATAQGDVEPGGYRLLAHLVTEGPSRTTALAEALSFDTSTVSRQTSALVKAGLLERRPDAADGRACLLAATDDGVRAFEHARRTRELHISQMLADWDDGELRGLVATLDRFTTDCERYRPILAAGGHNRAGPVVPARDDGACAHPHDLHTGETTEGKTVR